MCPHALVGYLIGKKGVMIKRIKVGVGVGLGLGLGLGWLFVFLSCAFVKYLGSATHLLYFGKMGHRPCGLFAAP